MVDRKDGCTYVCVFFPVHLGHGVRGREGVAPPEGALQAPVVAACVCTCVYEKADE